MDRDRSKANLFHLKLKRNAVLAFAFFAVVIVATAFAALHSSPAAAKSNPRYASIVMDADTGLILHQRYAGKSLHPASLTKVMTLLMAFEALERGELRLNDRLYISKRAASMVPSKLGLKPGESIKVRDAIYILVTKSANDVAVAMAEHLSGTESAFARKMTQRARSIGMSKTNFRNASGLHHKAQVTTAKDMARMARYVINEYPEYYRYFNKKSFTYKGKTYRSHNRLMGKYKGMDGMKTGYIQASGFNLVASAVRNNRRVIGVVFGGRTGKSRNAHMSSLMDRGFAKLNEIRVANAKVPLPQRKPQALAAAISLRNISPTAGSSANRNSSYQSASVTLSPQLRRGMFGKLIGEGDYDPLVSRRIETGLLAIAAHSGNKIPNSLAPPPTLVSQSVGQAIGDSLQSPWGIQIGAFKTRTKTNSILRKVLGALPEQYANAKPLVMPVKTTKGWLYRARITGYTQSEALGACKLLHNCLPIAP